MWPVVIGLAVLIGLAAASRDGPRGTSRLGRYFTLADLTRSATAAGHGWSNQPNQEAIDNLEWGMVNVVDPFVSAIGGGSVSSGYRTERLNRAVGGVEGSWHMSGNAVDIVPPAGISKEVAMARLQNLINEGLPLDKGIMYAIENHIHLTWGIQPGRQLLYRTDASGRETPYV